MIRKKEFDPEQRRKDIGVRSILIMALATEAIIADIVLMIASYLIPAPLAEYMAFFYTYAKGGSGFPCVLFGILFVAAVSSCILSATEKLGRKWFIKIPAALFVTADFGLHSYAFLAASGYGWNYLVSAALDIVMLFAVLYPAKYGADEAEELPEEENEENA